jgi:hypothetical protein
MSTPEGLGKDAVRRLLEDAKAAKAPIAWWMPTPAPGSVGLPDFIICAGGHFIAAEIKAQKSDGGRAPTTLQLRTIADILAAEGTALVVAEEDDFIKLHHILQDASGYNFARPAWRSQAVLTRRKPPSMRG